MNDELSIQTQKIERSKSCTAIDVSVNSFLGESDFNSLSQDGAKKIEKKVRFEEFNDKVYPREILVVDSNTKDIITIKNIMINKFKLDIDDAENG